MEFQSPLTQNQSLGWARPSSIKIQNSEGVSSAVCIKSVIEPGQCREGGETGEVKGKKETAAKSGENQCR